MTYYEFGYLISKKVTRVTSKVTYKNSRALLSISLAFSRLLSTFVIMYACASLELPVRF